MEKGKLLEKLIHLANENDICVSFVPLRTDDGKLDVVDGETRIGIRADMEIDDYLHILSHELAHYYLHFDKGDTKNSAKHDEYEEEAERTVNLILSLLKK